MNKNQNEVSLVLVATERSDYTKHCCTGCFFRPVLHGEFCKAPNDNFPCLTSQREDGRSIVWKLKYE